MTTQIGITSKVKTTNKTKIKTKISNKKKLLSNIDDLIKEVNEDPTFFAETYDADTLIQIIDYAMHKYYNEQPIMDDAIYDFLIDIIKDIDPTHPILKKVGSTIMTKNKVKLPYYMGSMDKIKPSDTSVLNKWFKDYTGPYVYSEKLDGVSGLLVCSGKDSNGKLKLNLYTRGDGIDGTVITPLIKYIPSINPNVIKMVDGMAIRGELIMSKKNFSKYADKMANARNMVSGIVNSKSIDPKIITDVDFVAYEIINPWFSIQSNHWKSLTKAGFKVVNNGLIKLATESVLESFAQLSNALVERKLASEYEIDGIIISSDELPKQRTIDSNPEYAFAYKDTSQLDRANVKVINVEWSISKDGYIKPKLNIEPTKLGGVTISNVTAFNAKFVKDNILGPGAVIELIRSGDVIPHIVKVVKPATSGKAQFPSIDYVWTDTNVDIITVEETTGQRVKELTFFFKKLDIKDIDESTVKKMIDFGIDDIEKILNIDESDLEGIDGFKEKKINKIVTNIKNRIKTLSMIDLMIASNTFGHGLGERKLKKIMEIYPDIIKLYSDYDNEDIIEMIKEIDGFDVKTAEYFTNGLDIFIVLFNNLEPNIRKQLINSINKLKEDQINKSTKLSSSSSIADKFKDKTFVFSGFRNKDWEKIIESNGGKVSTSVSGKTYAVVSTQADIDDGSNSKISKAISLGLRVLSKEQFEQEFILSNI
jgi:DNA ligase (NAD+)